MAERPRKLDWAVLGLLVALVPIFGALVVWRSAYMDHRHTDFEVYARAGWAVRTGQDMYSVTAADGLHYCYPPPFAILMAPFAESPDATSGTAFLTFGISVAVWYLLSVGCLAVALHWLASAVEGGSVERGSRRWWALRVVPMIVALPAIGNTLSHGQVNTLLLLLIAGCFTAVIARRSLHAGLWLAGGIALKVIPGFLLLAPVLRRDRRWLAGSAVGLIILLLVFPALIYGPMGAWKLNRRFAVEMIHPAMAGAADADRAAEMFAVLRTDNQSIQAVLHAWQHGIRDDAPAEPGPRTRAAHWLLAALLTGTTIWAGRRARCFSRHYDPWQRFDNGHRRVARFHYCERVAPDPQLLADVGAAARANLLLFLGALTTVMLFVSPMCHLHYYCLTIPLVTALLHRWWQARPVLRLSAGQLTLVVLHVVGGSFPLIFESYRNFGFAPLSTLPLWGYAIVELWDARPAAGQVTPALPWRKAA